MDIFENSCTGRFDSSNFGLWLNLDYALKHPLGQHLVTPMMMSFHAPIGRQQRDFVAGLSNADDIAFAINCFSMFSHEMRHFHDLLATPYGSMLMRQYTRAAITCLSCRPELLFKTKKIVVPLSDWVNYSRLFKKAFAVDPPSDNLIKLNEEFTTMKTKFDVFNKGIIKLNGRFEHLDAISILEGLAILSQEILIKNEFGQDKIKYFRNSFASETSARTYFGALSFITNFLEQNLPHEIISYLLFASLCGNFQDTDPSHLRYPKDILVAMLSWIKQHRIDVGRIESFERLMEIVDDFFEEKLGNDVQGMIIQAAKANEQFEQTLLNDIRDLEHTPWSANKEMKLVMEVFNNFRLVQASFSSNIMINPHWYVSRRYVDNQYKLPAPVLFLETEIGLPVDEQLEKLYYIQSEIRIDLNRIPEEIRKLTKGITDKEGVARAATILSPRTTFFNAGHLDEDITWWFEVPEINVDLWQKSYDAIGTEIRCFLEGGNRLMNKTLFDVYIFSKAMFGTEVYSTSGKFETIDLPDDLSTPGLDPVLRKLFSDEAFRKFVIQIRAAKAKMD